MKRKRIVTSKDFNKVYQWAIETHRQVMWKSNDGLWHAAIDERKIPFRSQVQSLFRIGEINVQY